MHVVVQCFQYGGFSVEFLDLCLKGRFTVLRLDIDELVDDHGRDEWAADAVKSLADAVMVVFVPGFDVFAVFFPEISWQLQGTRIEQV